MPTEMSASAFIMAIGVNSAVSFTNTPYVDTAKVISAMQYLGLSTLRDVTPDPTYAPTWAAYGAIANAGIKFDFLTQVSGDLNLSTIISSLHAFEAVHPGSIAAIEGPNELNIYPVTYNGITDPYAAGAQFIKDLSAAVKADPLLSSIPIYAPTLAVDPAGETQLGNLSNYVTYGAAMCMARKATTSGRTTCLTGCQFNSSQHPGSPQSLRKLVIPQYPTSLAVTPWMS